MAKAECCVCGKYADARSMERCEDCGRYLCTDCAYEGHGRCGECAQSEPERGETEDF